MRPPTGSLMFTWRSVSTRYWLSVFARVCAMSFTSVELSPHSSLKPKYGPAPFNRRNRKGYVNPFGEEESEVWEYRLSRVREQFTDQIFTRYLSFELFEQLVWEVLSERGIQAQKLSLSMNPELAPLEMVFQQALSIENLPSPERAPLEARLKESKVVLIRTLISDQLRYINVAKEWFTVSDLIEIRQRKLGTGRIGGKTAGMLLAMRILEEAGDEDIKECICAPDSYFIGSDVFYTFMSINNLVHWNDQKYKSEAEMRADYPQIAA